MLSIMILAAAAMQPARGQSAGDRKQEVDLALDQYGAAQTADQRATVIDYLRHLDRKLVAGAVIEHIIASQNGDEATKYNTLIEIFAPDGCTAVLDRLAITDNPTAKGKLIVALRHCQSQESLHALAACLGDQRPFLFEVHGPLPRRVCDLAYDELFLKLRNDRHYGLDPSPRMNGLITEKTAVKTRDTLISELKAKLAHIPLPSASPSATPEPAKPATASVALL